MTKRGWVKRIIAKDEPTGNPVEVYRRDIKSYADEIQNGKHWVALKTEELAAAQEQLRHATEQFIRHCAELDLPIEMEPTEWPTKPYRLEDQ